MRIGIVTQPLTTNYGGILQNYALQQVLKRMGHEVWTMDYYRYTWLDWCNGLLRFVAHKLLGHSVRMPNSPKKRGRLERPLRRFVERYIRLTEPRTKGFEQHTIRKYTLDGIVVGSDQVWRPCYNSNIENCFLKFTQGLNLRRVAYAASFGTDDWEFAENQTNICAQLARSFDRISVREESGVGLCREHLNVDAVHVLDPTLLLHAEDYIRLCNKIPKRSPFVFAYILDDSEEKKRDIIALANRKGLPYIIKSAGARLGSDDSVELWLSYFRDAAFVITDSFHGTAFSINFNKDFYVFSNSERGNSRFDSLLGMLELKDRIIAHEISDDQSINWDRVNQLRENTVKYSVDWLETALK